MTTMAILPDLPHRVPASALREYRSLEREGLVRTILGDDIYVASHITDCPSTRARAIHVLIPEAVLALCTVAGPAAAWVMLGGAQPTQIDVLVPPRVRRRADPPVVLHQSALPPEHVMSYADLALTTPIRTAVDLARTESPVRAWAWLDRLTRLGVTADDALRCLSQLHHRRGVRRAQRIITAWADDETDSVLVGAAAGDPGDVEDTFDPPHS
jgi:hypothetical protein